MTVAVLTSKERARAALQLIGLTVSDATVDGVTAAIETAVRDEAMACAAIAERLADANLAMANARAAADVASMIAARIRARAQVWPAEVVVAVGPLRGFARPFPSVPHLQVGLHGFRISANHAVPLGEVWFAGEAMLQKFRLQGHGGYEEYDRVERADEPPR
jgi:hypothetical protein